MLQSDNAAESPWGHVRDELSDRPHMQRPVGSQFTSGPRQVPLSDNLIHPEWCGCGSCALKRRRSMRTDLGIIGLGFVVGLLAILGSWLGVL